MKLRSPALAGSLGLFLTLGFGFGCEAELEQVPEGALALVGNEVIWPEELETRRAQLDAYGQRRFGREGGRIALLEAAISERLLILEAKRRGLDSNPRVQWAITEELARLQLAAELERRVPEQSVADDEAALRAYYEANIDAFTEPERRSAELFPVESLEDGEELIRLLATGETTWEVLGEGSYTAAQARDDERFPMLHRLLFDPDLEIGEVIAVPVYAQLKFHVARLKEVVPARAKDFDDPRVRAELVDAVRAPRLERAKTELMAELAERYPITTVDGRAK